MQEQHQQWTAHRLCFLRASLKHLFIRQIFLLCSVLQLGLNGSVHVACPHGAAGQEGKTTKHSKVKLLW